MTNKKNHFCGCGLENDRIKKSYFDFDCQSNIIQFWLCCSVVCLCLFIYNFIWKLLGSRNTFLLCRYLIIATKAGNKGSYHKMSTVLLAVVAVILCILFRILNVNSQPQKPVIFGRDRSFIENILFISPFLSEP